MIIVLTNSICLLTCTTFDHTQPQLMATWIIISYLHTTDINTIEKHSISTF